MNDVELQKACEILAARDPRLETLISSFGIPDFRAGGIPYEALVRSIISQQISWKAAQAIRGRFLALFPESDFPPPEALAVADVSQLRLAGLSQRKAEYVIAIARAFLDPEFLGDNLHEASDSKVSEKLTSIRGVGQWTADMFMIFTLARPDILPLNDQGIKNGMEVFFGLDHSPTATEMLGLTEHWKPYRSIASWYMWKVVDEAFQWDEEA
jgi:DNA-3-methyladenine glycosylase II